MAGGMFSCMLVGYNEAYDIQKRPSYEVAAVVFYKELFAVTFYWCNGV